MTKDVICLPATLPALRQPVSCDDEVTTTRKNNALGDYEARVDARRGRLEARAEKARADSAARYQASKERASMIPFGQPILVGHHSESRARRDADRIYNDMGKSVAAQKQAERLETRAESVGTAGIASDDPEAIQKLKTKLDALVRSQELMKSVNKLLRSKKLSESEIVEQICKQHGLRESEVLEIMKPDHCKRIGFASYALQNNNATIRTTRMRIEELEKLHNQKPLDDSGVVGDIEWTLYEEEGRVKFKFDDIPPDEVRKLLKSNGFKWSRYCGAWVRKLTANATATAEHLSVAFKKLS